MPVVTFRHPKPGSISARAEALGLSRSAYLARIVDEDLERPAPRKRKIRLDDLLGSIRSGRGSDNASVRAAFRRAGP